MAESGLRTRGWGALLSSFFKYNILYIIPDNPERALFINVKLHGDGTSADSFNSFSHGNSTSRKKKGILLAFELFTRIY